MLLVGGIAGGCPTVSDVSGWDELPPNPNVGDEPVAWFGAAFVRADDSWEPYVLDQGGDTPELVPLGETLALEGRPLWYSFEADGYLRLDFVGLAEEPAPEWHEMGLYGGAPDDVGVFSSPLPGGGAAGGLALDDGRVALSKKSEARLWRWRRFGGEPPTALDLSHLADADGNPDARTLAWRGDDLLVALHRTDGPGGDVSSAGAVIAELSANDEVTLWPTGERPQLHAPPDRAAPTLVSVASGDGTRTVHALGTDDPIGDPLLEVEDTHPIRAIALSDGRVVVLHGEGEEAVLTCIEGAQEVEVLRTAGVPAYLHVNSRGAATVSVDLDDSTTLLADEALDCGAGFDAAWDATIAGSTGAAAFHFIDLGR